MKTILVFFTLILSNIISYGQKEINILTYENTQDILFFRSIKNRTLVKEYISSGGNSIKIGDTIILGKPTSQETKTRTYTGSYGYNASAGIEQSRSTIKKTYEFIQLGRKDGFGNILVAASGEDPVMATISLKNTEVIVKEMSVFHRGSKKKPLYIEILLGEKNGKAFGVNKYLSVTDAELAIEYGEILLKNKKKTREEAIAELKEAKDLVDIDMMSKEEFEELKKELAPFINTNKNK